MSGLLVKIRKYSYIRFLKTPFLNRFNLVWYSKLGVHGTEYRFSALTTVVGEYSNISLGKQAEINTGCFLLAKDKIIVGDNSTLAYQVTILTSANPNGPHNVLSRLYPSMKKPVIIGCNSWIGAKATILPGVSIGDYCIVAAGALVTKNVPNYTVVAGVPAKEIKKLDKKLLMS